MSRDRALAACEPFPVSARLIQSFPDLIGRNGPNNGSPETHFTDANLGLAIAMPASEAQLLYDISVARDTWDDAVEIGAYVGWSTAHLLASKPRGHYFSGLTVIDPFTETYGTTTATEERFWDNLKATGLASVNLVRERSPHILPVVKPRDGWDLALIDGNHHADNPVKDIQGLLPCLASGAIVIWHDGWMPTVLEGISWLVAQGWDAVPLPTANVLTVCYRGDRPSWLDGIEAKARTYVGVANG